MPNVLLVPTYIPNIYFFYKCLYCDKLILKMDLPYRKQTYMNRAYIAGANSILKLIVPINSKGKSTKKYKDIKICRIYDWQRNHWKTIQNCYKKAPFFEFYEDKIHRFYSQKYRFLVDLNMDSIKLIYDLIDIPFEFSFRDDIDSVDLTSISFFKKSKSIHLPKYEQIFSDRYPFSSNLSIIDLILCRGRDVFSYFDKITLV